MIWTLVTGWARKAVGGLLLAIGMLGTYELWRARTKREGRDAHAAEIEKDAAVLRRKVADANRRLRTDPAERARVRARHTRTDH